MELIESYRTAFRWAWELLGLVMADATVETTHWQPPGTANSIAATYAHALCSTDAILHRLFQSAQPLYEGAWLDRTGVSSPQWSSDQEWARNVRVELKAAAAYGQAVFNAVDAFLMSLNGEDADREIDLSAFSLGARSLDWCLNALVIGHLNNLTGEISAIKGVQGGKGFPF